MPVHQRNLIILSITIFLAACSWNQITPFLPLYIESMDPDGNIAQWSGIIFAMHFISAFFAQPLWGKLGDRVGRKPMIIRAGLGLVLVYFGMSFSTAPWHLAVWRLINGAVTGFIPSSITLIATNTPDNLAARYVALAQSAAAAGSIAGPALGGLLASLFGYRLSLRVSGTIVLLSTIAVWALIREHKTGGSTESTTIWQDLQVIFRSRVLQGVMLTVILTTALNFSITPILTLYLRQLTPATTDFIRGTIFSLPGLAFVLMAYRWSRMGDRRGYEPTIIAGFIGSGFMMIALAFVQNIWLFSAGYFVYGVFAAALGPGAAALIATKVPEDFRGRAYGVQQSASMLGGLAGPLLGGWIGAQFGLRYIFMVMGVVGLLGCFPLQRIFRPKEPVPAGARAAGKTSSRTTTR